MLRIGRRGRRLSYHHSPTPRRKPSEWVCGPATFAYASVLPADLGQKVNLRQLLLWRDQPPSPHRVINDALYTTKTALRRLPEISSKRSKNFRGYEKLFSFLPLLRGLPYQSVYGLWWWVGMGALSAISERDGLFERTSFELGLR